jgi:hypothetical protein
MESITKISIEALIQDRIEKILTKIRKQVEYIYGNKIEINKNN